MEELHLRADGTIDCDYYSARARLRWGDAPDADWERRPAYPRVTPRLRRRAKGCLAALLCANAAFGFTLSAPPHSVAPAGQAINIQALHETARLEIPRAEPDAL